MINDDWRENLPIKWDLNNEQIKLLKKHTPDLVTMIMMGINGMAVQAHDADDVLRKSIADLDLELKKNQSEVLLLRAEVARLREEIAAWGMLGKK